MINGGLSIIPNVNLVKNIGFDLDATNTRYSIEETSINQGILPLSHPMNIVRHKEADQYTFNTRFSSLSLKKIIIVSLKKPFYYLLETQGPPEGWLGTWSSSKNTLLSGISHDALKAVQDK